MRRRAILMIALALLVTVGSALPGSAKTDRIEFAADDYVAGFVDPGTEWMSGPVYHLRGLTLEYDTVGPEIYDGVTVVEININRNTETGKGTLWGTWELTLDASDGGYAGTWVASFTGEASPEWTGHGVGKGFGDAAGSQIRIELTQQPYGDSVTGVLFMPGNK